MTPNPKINELTTSTAASPGELKTGNSGAEPAEMVKGLGDGGTGGEQAAKNEKTAELLHEATQLLKTLRIPPSTPQLKVMQIGGLDHTEANRVLIDSGATHGLRPARDHDEWLKSTRTTVQLANGSTEAFRLKPGTKILLGHPEEAATWIVPMGGLTDLDFTMTWSGNQCQLRDDEGRQIDVQVIHGCPMISLADGQMILQWLEAHQVHQQRKLAMVRTLMNDESHVDQSQLDLEMALTLKLRQHFPDLPDEVMMRVVPYLEMVKAESFQSRLPWNRHKRRRLKKAKHVVIHLFSGPDQTYWDRRCASETTEVLCVDTTCSTPANLLDKNVYAYLVALCASGRVRSILGGPPCRTLTALRYQGDDGPGVLRTDEYPYGLPSLSPADTELVLNDSTLMFRFWSLLIMAEEFRPDDMPVTQFFHGAAGRSCPISKSTRCGTTQILLHLQDQGVATTGMGLQLAAVPLRPVSNGDIQRENQLVLQRMSLKCSSWTMFEVPHQMKLSSPINFGLFQWDKDLKHQVRGLHGLQV